MKNIASEKGQGVNAWHYRRRWIMILIGMRQFGVTIDWTIRNQLIVLRGGQKSDGIVRILLSAFAAHMVSWNGAYRKSISCTYDVKGRKNKIDLFVENV